jgi:hypothetical protein
MTTITNFKFGSSTIRAAAGDTSEWVLMHRSSLKPNIWGQPKFSQEESIELFVHGSWMTTAPRRREGEEDRRRRR